jgi:NitT/TauT family transport system permease protein
VSTAVRTEQVRPTAPRPARSAAAARRRRRLVINLQRLGIVAVVLALWQWLTAIKVVDPFFWGSPSGVAQRLWEWVSQGTAQGSLLDQILTTLQEAVYGFAIGTVLGVVLGISLGRSDYASQLLSPFIKAANSIPRIILGSIFTVAFGFGMQSKVILSAVLVFFGVFFNAFQGTREVDRNIVNNARLLGADRWQVTRQVVLPSAFTWILASLHISFGFAIIGAIVGEILGSDAGLGLLIRNAQNNFDMNGVMGGMVLVALIALVAEALITLVEKRLLSWRPPQHQTEAVVESA